MVEETYLRANKAYAVWYIFWSKFIFIEVIPYLTIIILNSAIVRKIWKSNNFRRRFLVSSATGSGQSQMTASAVVPPIEIDIDNDTIERVDIERVGEPSNGNGNQPSSPVEMTARQRREANLGIVLVSISVLFIICQSVKIIPDVYEIIYCKRPGTSVDNVKNCHHEDRSVINSLVDVSHLLLAINSSVNVIIYTLRGTHSVVDVS